MFTLPKADGHALERVASLAQWPAATSRWQALRFAAWTHFSPFKVYLRRDRGVAVVLNPKAGSTAFRMTLMQTLKQSGASLLLGRHWPLNHTRRLLTAPPGDLLHAALNPENYSAYCFVRNPYARLLSAWRDKFAAWQDESNPPRALARTLPTLRRFARRRGLPLDSPYAKVPLTTFVAYLESQPEGRRDHHWDTQRSVLCSHLIRYRQIFRLETEFVTGTKVIFSQLGLPTDGLAEKLSQYANASRKLPVPSYDKELAERVYRLYLGDFEWLGYDRDSWQGL